MTPSQFALLLIAALVATVLACLWLRNRNAREYKIALENAIGDGTHAEGRITKLADAAVSTRYLLAKEGTDVDHVNICGAADRPLAIYTDEAAAIEDPVGLEILGLGNRTFIMVASEAITVGSDVYTAANGKVQDEPAIVGTYYRVGRAITAASADAQTLVVAHYAPVKVIVLALPGNANSEISGLTIGGTYSQSEVGAILTKCEELADDFRALATALSSPAEVKWLAS